MGDLPGKMYMPTMGVHHCHLLSRPLLARETMTLDPAIRFPIVTHTNVE